MDLGLPGSLMLRRLGSSVEHLTVGISLLGYFFDVRNCDIMILLHNLRWAMLADVAGNHLRWKIEEELRFSSWLWKGLEKHKHNVLYWPISETQRANVHTACPGRPVMEQWPPRRWRLAPSLKILCPFWLTTGIMVKPNGLKVQKLEEFGGRKSNFHQAAAVL